MKILFVVDQLPYPPRNGVTIPTFNYVSGLALKHDVFMILLAGDLYKPSDEQLAENRRYVNELWVVQRRRRPKLVRIKDELTMRTPYRLGWDYQMDQLEMVLKGQQFDVVWASPFRALDTVGRILPLLRSKSICVAGINDCITAVYRNMGKKFFLVGKHSKSRMLFAIGWLRSWVMGRMEYNVLKTFDLILVQTEIEREWLNAISNEGLSGRVMVVSNGVNEVLFELPIRFRDENLLFFGSLDEEYGEIISWIIHNVWPKIASVKKNMQLSIIGQNASRHLRKEVELYPGIIYKEHVSDIRHVFNDKALMVAPVFKNYGLINKVVEAMAAGVPVVGDSGSFNGIPGFKHGRQGIIANTAENMASAVLNLLDSPKKYFQLAYSARNLVRNHFLWEDRIVPVEEKLTFLVDSLRSSS